VHRAATRLGYRPDRQARSLRTRATTVLGLIISDIQNPFFTAIARGVEDAASARGFSVVLANADEDLAKEQRYLEVAAAERMAGVVLSPATATRTRIDVLRDRHIPLVTIDGRIRTAAVDSVTVDNREAAREAVAHLIEQGCRHIGVISGRMDVSTTDERFAGYQDALRAAGLLPDPGLCVRGGSRVECGRAAATRLMAREPRPDGLFIADNLMTVGAIGALNDLGVRCPDDVALAGFDDSSRIGLGPPLTLVEQPTYDIGRTATELLLRRIAGEAFDVRDIVLPATLRIRDSSLRARGGRESAALID
jgi:LacI family transcriptional regulator